MYFHFSKLKSNTAKILFMTSTAKKKLELIYTTVKKSASENVATLRRNQKLT